MTKRRMAINNQEEQYELKSNQKQTSIFTQRKSSGIQSEFQKQLSEIIKRIEELLRDNHGECEIPDELLKEIARCLVPDIIAFFETEEAKREFEVWKLEQSSNPDKKKS